MVLAGGGGGGGGGMSTQKQVKKKVRLLARSVASPPFSPRYHVPHPPPLSRPRSPTPVRSLQLAAREQRCLSGGEEGGPGGC